ncbi:MAG: tyrosine-protein phosphatase [Dehalococcoidales bacterium]|jgi:protein-tyrosine phosphatase
MTEVFSRHLRLESVANFRDIGGYRARGGKTVAWRRVFRSGEFSRINDKDFKRVVEELGLASVVDLRSSLEVESHGLGPLKEAGLKYRNISFMPEGGDPAANERRFNGITNLGDFYLYLVQEKTFNARLIEALEIIAAPENHPLVFHCAIGKDRTGILAAVLLDLLGVEKTDIIEDYALSGPYMAELIQHFNREQSTAPTRPPIPDVFWGAVPESMSLFLSSLYRDYGSGEGYLKAQGADPSLKQRLEDALLI